VRGGGAMTVGGVVAEREGRGHAPTLAGEHAMADAVHPALHPVQPPALNAEVDRAVADPDEPQLPACDHTVLHRGQRRNRCVDPE